MIPIELFTPSQTDPMKRHAMNMPVVTREMKLLRVDVVGNVSCASTPFSASTLVRLIVAIPEPRERIYNSSLHDPPTTFVYVIFSTFTLSTPLASFLN
jgi:hypothetical protein